MALPGGGLIRFGRRAAATDAPGSDEVAAALPTPMLVLNAQNQVADANAAAELLLNQSRAALVGRQIAELIGHDMESLAADAPFAAYDEAIDLPGRRRLQADVMAAPLPDRPGWRVVTIHSRAPSHIAHRRADREGGKLTAVGAAAMLAHEIKNPLSAIRGAAQLVEGSDPGSRDLTALIRDEVDRIAALIDRMEGFTDTRPLEITPQNIHAILAHAREVALQGFARGCEIKELYDPSLPSVLGHRDALIQILINLMKNAAEAMGGTGVIRLSTAYRHGVSRLTEGGDGRRALPIEVCVIDEGPGAPPELGDHLFDPFVTTKRTGSGLGLALVDKLVADQGAMVEYAREGDPARTVFRLLLPRMPG
ncbi:ATP-binding protein [Sphingomonas sp. 1P06PA]|uniref:two-component system sensor histidine kinase NtrB n=1 Tax=Sphingomonas sp. 1P06PA TaxID=554121 RepID=UPI0039A75C01